jgi:hypothetical protein
MNLFGSGVNYSSSLLNPDIGVDQQHETKPEKER